MPIHDQRGFAISMTRQSRIAVLVAGIAAAAVTPAAANPPKSLYSTIELGSCKQTQRHRDGGAWLCKGLEGYPIYVAEGDLRMFVSVGKRPDKRKAATQTLGPFNSLFKGNASRATLEWRFVKRNGKVVPYATIQRFFTQNDDGKGEVLVVTKVTEKEDCHVAYIDALANPQAIALARKVADEEARKFDCRTDPKRVGAVGKSPM
jgi:hypothetical protein